MDEETTYADKYRARIVANVGDPAGHDDLTATIDEIYTDGFTDGTNEAPCINCDKPRTTEVMDAIERLRDFADSWGNEMYDDDGDDTHKESRESLAQAVATVEAFQLANAPAIPADVHSEAFNTLLHATLTKFVAENDDMAIMDIHAKARALLDAINDL